MSMYIGFAGYFQLALFEHPARAEKVASLVVDHRWPWPPISGSFGVRNKIRDRTRRQRYTKQKGRDGLRDGILDPDHRDLRLSHRADAERNHGSMEIELTPEGEQVRRALEEVLAPVIVPAWPGEQSETR